jgi:tripartite-type tricarboxylate transporter receptor subunit TctC
MINRRGFLRVGAGAVLCARTSRALASDSATLTRVVVGFPPNGPVDIAARLFCPLLSERLEEPFETVNMPGDSGNAATAHVIAAKPDGRTLLMCGPVNAINTTLFRSLPFNFATDLMPVAGLYSVPLVVEVHPSVPAQSASDFIRLAKSRPNEIRVGYAGLGTPQHIAIELFNVMAGVSLKLMPYAGSAPALADLLAGQLDAMFDPTPSSIEHLRAGRLRALAVTGKTRLGPLPDVPVMSEFVPSYEAGSWFGLCAPRATAVQRIQALNAAANAALGDRAVQARLDALGAQTMPGSPSGFAELIALETKKYARVIEQAGIARR